MLLEPDDYNLFFRLHQVLMSHVNRRLGVIPNSIATLEEFFALSQEPQKQLRSAFLAHLDLIDSFVAENPANLPAEELDIIESWRGLISGEFILYRQLKEFAVFMSTNNPTRAYGVLALYRPFETVIRSKPPKLVEAVLLPFKNKIIYDSSIITFNTTFSPNQLQSLEKNYQAVVARRDIITLLTRPPTLGKLASPLPKPAFAPQSSSKEKDNALVAIVNLIDKFCQEHLDEEHNAMCRRLAEKLAHKRPSPLRRGSPNVWANGIVRVISGVNPSRDKTPTSQIKTTDIDHHLKTTPSSGAAKAAQIRKLINIRPLDPNWTLPSLLENNPMAWLLEINNASMDIRKSSRETQEAAFRKGIIPYIPADRSENHGEPLGFRMP